MAKDKTNCWEFMKCGREPGGDCVGERGVCRASIDASYDGINDGDNAGRICWAVAGTCCNNEIQGTYAEKRKSCISCPFYKEVQEQEGTSAAACKLIRLFTEDENSPFLDMMTCKNVKAGERIATQGEIRETSYIIQRGSCLVLVEKDGSLYPSGHRCRGEMVGITSVLTGEPQRAHIEAETDLELWVLDKGFFDRITQEDQSMVEFLTEVVASRFNSKRPISDRRIGKYVATDIIGSGAFSIVYRGYHSELNMPVAIKMMKHDLYFYADFQKSMIDEAQTIAKLSHENIITVYDIEERFKTIFIIMEYLEGSSLRDMISVMKRVPIKSIVLYLVQLCRGLQYAHDRNIVHQDIKPGNIFILPNDKIRILDFGLASPFGSEGYMVGSPHYMAPEQVECFPVDNRTDIYSVGITTYEMLTGERPFKSDNMFEIQQMRVDRNIPDPAELVPDLPEALRGFILRACSRAPDDRYSNMREAREALEPLARQYGIPGSIYKDKKKNIASVFLVYSDEHESALQHLLTEISTQAGKMGIKMNSTKVDTE